MVDGVITASEPIWKPNDTTDPTWCNDDSFYQGGDYDINTFTGAIASTVMKMQIWCPNAVVVVATPFPRFGSDNLQYKNSKSLSFRRMCEIEKNVAHSIGAEVVDANGECNINGIEFSKYVTDGVHPNLEGRKMYGRVFIGKLGKIYPKV